MGNANYVDRDLFNSKLWIWALLSMCLRRRAWISRVRMSVSSQAAKDERSLGRLETLVDSVFALVLVLFVLDFPRPDSLSTMDLGEFLAVQVQTILQTAIGLVVVLTYWIQSNSLCGNLKATDNKHASITIVQVFFVLLYL
jgi:uncharacterized membrane protein